ncbi:MAG: fusaric acid resistance protein, partial [Pseudomonas sp.]|nr:fusaric acid resistance protein [Pseudomonas sp.]
AGLDLGDELLHLRKCLANADAGLARSQRRFLVRLDDALERGPAPGGEDDLNAAVVELQEALRACTPSIDKRLAEAALLQLQNGWRHWCQLRGGANGLA